MMVRIARTTFETLFPALEPGRYYIIESLRSFRSVPRVPAAHRPATGQPDRLFLRFDPHPDDNGAGSGSRLGLPRLCPQQDRRGFYLPPLLHGSKKPVATRDSAQFDAVGRLAATIGTAEAWGPAALFINANGGGVERTIAALNSAIGLGLSTQLFRYLSEMHATAGRMDEAARIAQRAAHIKASEHDYTEALEHDSNLLIATDRINKAPEVFTAALEGVTHPVIRHRILARIAELQGRV
jgi:hypothetical protein